MAKLSVSRMRKLVWAVCFVALAAGAVQAEQAGVATVRADLERFIRARVEDGSVAIKIPNLAIFEFDRSRHPGALRTELSSRSREPFRGRVSVTVALYAGDRLVKRNVVSAYVRVTERIVVASRDLRRGDILEPGDLTHAERDSVRMPTDAIRSIEDALGFRMKRSLRRDRELRRSQIEKVPLVERGDRVMLVLESGALRIQAIGRTKEAGAAGEWIRVINVDSKRELSGRLDREGRVHVAF